MSILSIREISKSFEKTLALGGISFDVKKGETVALLGPSGCGKSTLLSVIAGLEPPDHGDIQWNGTSLAAVPPHLRGFGLMFQDFALFPHMDAYANIAFGLKMAHMDPASIDQRVQEMLDIVGLPDFSKRDVNTLSGGEQQRIALARALAPKPSLLMLDEPLGSLDRNLRERLVTELKAILRGLNQTAIYVTHDQEEAFVISDRVILMNSGRIEQIGTPNEIYRDPGSLFVARFLEMTNIIPGTVHENDGIRQLTSPIGSFSVNTSRLGDVLLLLRPDLVRLDDKGPTVLSGEFTEVSFRGSRQRVTILVNDLPLIFEFPFSVDLPVIGSQVAISLTPGEAIKIFASD
jgi:ABC-type Fe3+/spermidine/putrescine transport system ATPase subunit